MTKRRLPADLPRATTLALLRDLREATDPETIEGLEGRLVSGNLRFCYYQAHRYKRPELELDDLVSVATGALLEAIRRFDLTISTHFAAFARRCIRRDLIVFVRRQASPLRLPREPRAGELRNGRTGALLPEVVSLPMGTGTGRVDDALTVENPEPDLVRGLDAARLGALVDALPERDAHVVRMRFGLVGLAPHELAEIGVVLNITKQRVQAILDKALATLKTMLTTRAAA